MHTIHVLWPDACGSRAILKEAGQQFDYPDHSLTVFTVLARRGRFTLQPFIAVSVPNGPWCDLSPTILPAWSYSLDEMPIAGALPTDHVSAYGRGTLARIDVDTYQADELVWSEFRNQCLALRQLALRRKVLAGDIAKTLATGDDLLFFEFYHNQFPTLDTILRRIDHALVSDIERLVRTLYDIAAQLDAWNQNSKMQLTVKQCHQVSLLVEAAFR